MKSQRLDAENYVSRLISRYSVVIFGKATCSYCDKAIRLIKTQSKGILRRRDIRIIELDYHYKVQNYLKGISGQRTVPNIFIGGHHVGGYSELKSIHNRGSLRSRLRNTCECHGIFQFKN